MLGNKPRPMIGRLSELLILGNRSTVVDIGTSPRSPLDLKVQSPRGMKNYDLGGVGLGIVAALEKSSNPGRDVLARYCLCRSSPRPVNSCTSKHPARFIDDEIEDLDEEYTYVTCHGPNKSVTKVYYNGDCHDGTCHLQVNLKDDFGLFKNSQEMSSRDYAEYPTSDFLSFCHLCRKKLHGQDIYMYRGEKAFCSPECRSSQIMMDERKEQCRSEAADVSTSPYTSGQIFSTGILAI